MEILAETTLWGSYLFVLIVSGLFSLVLGAVIVGAVFICIKERTIDINEIMGLVITMVLTALCAIGFTLSIKEGPVVEYTTVVTDYNEVYSQGYEIVRHEGKLVILTKESR